MPEAKMSFDEELAGFRQRTTKDPGYRGLILLGSGQADTAALLAGTLTKTERIAFLVTPQTGDFPARVAACLHYPELNWEASGTPNVEVCRAPSGDPAEATIWECHQLAGSTAESDEPEVLEVDVYQALMRLLDRWRDFDRSAIAADVTGGTKPMTIGLTKAAYVLQLPTIYILSKYAYNPKTARMDFIPGTQRLKQPADPYTVFGHLEAAEAERLFAAHDYSGAARIFSHLWRRGSGNPTVQDAELWPLLETAYAASRESPAVTSDHVMPVGRYAAFAILARAYAAWDAFALTSAYQALSQLLAGPLPLDLVDLAEPLHGQVEGLDRLKAVSDIEGARVAEKKATSATEKKEADEEKNKKWLGVLQDQTVLLPLLGSLYANGLRREANARYDLAALMLYRCLELLSQQRLASWSILAAAPDYTLARQCYPDFDAWYGVLVQDKTKDSVAIRSIPLPANARQPNNNLPKPPYKAGSNIALFEGYKILAALDDPLVHGYNIWQIAARSEARNISILAHGYRLITETEYEQFCKVVDKMLDRFFQVIGQDRTEWEKTYRFVNPFAAPARPRA